MDVSIYVKDAELLQLPLIGGLSKSHHDWLNLLRGWDMLEYGSMFGEILFWTGMAVALFGIVNGVRVAINEYRELKVSVGEP